MMPTRVQLARIFLIGAFITACATAGCLGGQDDEDEQVISGTGTIILVPQIGGLFGIMGDDGREYLPLNLDDQYKIHGQRVRFSARVRGDLAPLHQWGIPVEIIEIEFIPED